MTSIGMKEERRKQVCVLSTWVQYYHLDDRWTLFHVGQNVHIQLCHRRNALLP